MEPDPIRVVPGTLDHFPAAQVLLGGNQDQGCWCQYYRLSAKDYQAKAAGDGEARLRAQMACGPAPGMIAYLGGEPVGWLGMGPRAAMERLQRSKKIPRPDDLPVWSIVCFLVRTGYRRRGVASALLAGAIAHAREQGVPALEAYPIDSEGQRVDTTFAYVGTTAMFERAGFVRVLETESRSAGRRRWLMRLPL